MYIVSWMVSSDFVWSIRGSDVMASKLNAKQILISIFVFLSSSLLFLTFSESYVRFEITNSLASARLKKLRRIRNDSRLVLNLDRVCVCDNSIEALMQWATKEGNLKKANFNRVYQNVAASKAIGSNYLKLYSSYCAFLADLRELHFLLDTSFTNSWTHCSYSSWLCWER